MKIIEQGSREAFQPWYSYNGGESSADLPAFFDGSWSWTQQGEREFQTFRMEIENLLGKKQGILEPYFHTSLIAKGKWEVTDFYFWNKRDEKNCSECPALDKWLQSIPGMVTAGISRLAPGTEIKPHIGDTNLILRCHLGLSIPAELPDCGIKVKDETRAWKEGKFLIFCDAYRHSAWNFSDKHRYVLIIDIVLPRFIKKKKTISKNVRSFLLLQEVFEKKPWVKKLPGPLLGVIRHYFKFFVV